MVRTTDGFELAEVDLDLRGEGTVLGERQKGRNDLQLASLRRDREWVERAREVAIELVGDGTGMAGAPGAGRRGRAAARRRRAGVPVQVLTGAPGADRGSPRLGRPVADGGSVGSDDSGRERDDHGHALLGEGDVGQVLGDARGCRRPTRVPSSEYTQTWTSPVVSPHEVAGREGRAGERRGGVGVVERRPARRRRASSGARPPARCPRTRRSRRPSASSSPAPPVTVALTGPRRADTVDRRRRRARRRSGRRC